jgi:hypothetical protein
MATSSRSGRIGIQFDAAWAWGIDTFIPMRAYEMQGEGSDRRDCMRQFKAVGKPLPGSLDEV